MSFDQCTADTCATGCPLLDEFRGQFDPQPYHFKDQGLSVPPSARTLAIQHAKAGDFKRAIQLCQYALWQSPNDAQNYNNYGLMTRDLALQLEQSRRSEARWLLRESLAAFDLVLLKIDPKRDKNDADGARRYAAAQFQRIFPGECAADRCDHNQRLDAAFAHLRKGQQLKAVKTLCGGDDGGNAVKIPLREEEARCGIFSAQTVKNIYVTFRVCGVVKLPGVVETALVDQMLKDNAVTSFEPSSSSGSRTKDKRVVESINYASRSTDRYEVRLPHRSPFTDAVSSPSVLVGSKLLLDTRKIEVDTLSHVTAMPAAPEQHWHADVSHLFEASRQKATLPPHGIVVVLPLVPLQPVVGPTEYCLGSHLMMKEGTDFWFACDDENQRPTRTAAIVAEIGDVVLFDVRIRHRGGANKRQERRPIMYIGVVQDWYRDPVNFKQRQTSQWDLLEQPGIQKLFMRLDQAEYVKRLEDLVLASPDGAAQLNALRSKTEDRYRVVDLAV